MDQRIADIRIALNDAARKANPKARCCCKCNGATLAIERVTCSHCGNAGLCGCASKPVRATDAEYHEALSE